MKKIKILLITFIVFIADFISKFLVTRVLESGQNIKIIKNILYLTYVRNTGVAFNFLDGMLIFIILMTLVVIGFIFKYVLSNELSKFECLGYSLIIGGALGNLLDRVFYGYVIDFIDIYIFNYDYPVFNFADVAIVFGVIIILVINLKKESSDKNGDKSRGEVKN